MISTIVCVANNYAIGNKNGLLAHIPEDMRFFKETTMNNIVVMGRKTYDSFPKRPLPNRTNIVITSKVDGWKQDEEGTYWITMDIAKEWLEKEMDSDKKIFVIGGGQIYKELLPYCKRALITKVFKAYDEVDTYFPNIEETGGWELNPVSAVKEYNGLEYQFCEFIRKEN